MLGLGKDSKGYSDLCHPTSDEVPQYLEGVVWKAIRAAQLSRTYRPQPSRFGSVCRCGSNSELRWGFSM